MFEIEFADSLTKQITSDIDTNWDEDSREQFYIYLDKLKNSGEISGSHTARILGVPELAYLIPCRNFNIVYIVYRQLNLIRIYVSHVDPKKNLTRTQIRLEENWRNEEDDFNIYIPQADKPDKIVRTLELVNQGFNTSIEIGIQLGHKGRKAEYIARHGSYFCRAAVELKLLKRYRGGRSSYIYELTSKGNSIANNSDRDTQYYLLAQAMLEFYPVQVIFDEISLGKTALTIELIEELIVQFSYPSDRECKTIQRRAKCLMRWILMVAKVTQTPVRCTEEDCLQLYLPLLV